jgi:hypothetical protein
MLKWPWTMWTIYFPNTSEWLNVNIVFDHFYIENLLDMTKGYICLIRNWKNYKNNALCMLSYPHRTAALLKFSRILAK